MPRQILNFGRVSTGSVSAKNFVVANDLDHAVLVALVDLALQQTAVPNARAIIEDLVRTFPPASAAPFACPPG